MKRRLRWVVAGLASAVGACSLNPQPLPPGDTHEDAQAPSGSTGSGGGSGSSGSSSSGGGTGSSGGSGSGSGSSSGGNHLASDGGESDGANTDVQAPPADSGLDAEPSDAPADHPGHEGGHRD